MSWDPLGDFSKWVGETVAGAGAVVGEFLTGVTKPLAQEVLVPTFTQALEETLPVVRTETIKFVTEGSAAVATTTKETIGSFVPDLSDFVPIAIIAGAAIVGVAALRR